MNIELVILLLVAQIPGYAFAHNRHKAMRRCYDYAVARAKERDIMDPEGRAYSDMATVIALDGDAEPRRPLQEPLAREDDR